MIIIRPAQEGDAAGIAAVHVASWQSTYRSIVPDTFLDSLSVKRRAALWQKTLEQLSSTDVVLVCEDDGQILGFIWCGPPQEAIEDYDGEILALYLLKSSQGRGLGRRLFESGLAGMQNTGRKAAMLWVLADNPSRGFYVHMGGQELGQRKIQIGGTQLDELAYGWVLKEPI